MVRKSVLSERITKGLADPISEKEKLLVTELRNGYTARMKKKRKKQMSRKREDALVTINQVMDKGVEILGSEPIGFVLIYPDTAFLKVMWTDLVDSREDTAKALMDASIDELSKVKE